MTRNEQILKYYKRGKKQTDIARMFRISRQRIHQLIKKLKPQEDELTLY
jgi:DNA-binding transcriptional regulator LsrR (DeoR family)